MRRARHRGAGSLELPPGDLPTLSGKGDARDETSGYPPWVTAILTQRKPFGRADQRVCTLPDKAGKAARPGNRSFAQIDEAIGEQQLERAVPASEIDRRDAVMLSRHRALVDKVDTRTKLVGGEVI